MERIITKRLTHFIEKKEILTHCQSGFRKGRGTMEPIICLEHEIRKAQSNKESVTATFFDVEKAYDMMWKDGLLIKFMLMGVGGRILS